VWRERIDDATEAILASCFVISRGCTYGLSVFCIVESKKDGWFNWRAVGEQHFKQCLVRDYGGRLPMVWD
jgi:hypothetical protein